MTKKQDNKPESKPKKVDAVCEICKAEVKVPNLQKNACPECGRAGLVAA